MKYLCVIIVFCFSLSESRTANSISSDKIDTLSSAHTNTTSESNVWQIKLDILFTKNLPGLVEKPLGSDVKLRCEANLNFKNVQTYTKDKKVVTVSEKAVPIHILPTLRKNVAAYWMKDKKTLLTNSKIKIETVINETMGSVITTLRIKDITIGDEGNYSCVVKQESHQKRQTTLLKVGPEDGVENYEIPEYTPLFSNSDHTDLEIKTTADLIPEGMKVLNTSTTRSPKYLPDKLEPICQEYIGEVCKKHLSGHYVYIPHVTTQTELESKLLRAFHVTKYSNDISTNCEGYAVPSLCYSTFPICRDPLVTNDNFFKQAKQVLPTIPSEDNNNSRIVFENSSQHNITMEMLNYRHNSTVLRRVCKQDCEILENELCQTEYAIAKRHPHIGLTLTLEECENLPDNDPQCLQIGIGTVMVSDDECYWENGVGYLGKVNIANDNKLCIEWSKQTHVRISDHPELAGRHNYCRNPGGLNLQPWCVVDQDGKTAIQLCDIPKCAHKIWIYIVIVFVLITLSIVAFIICLCYRHRNKNNAATIRDINLPNADKNIYGNSRLNSPIEMSELLSNQNSINNQPHLTRNTRGNGVLRVPQYSLSQIKFLEELGEGAFGKVYKGALKKNGETLYVAVKALKENASTKTQADFRREIDLISELTHDNIVCIVGVALREEPLCMLFEFMARGDLHEFLMGRAPPSGKGLPPLRLLNIAHNIACGMQYLASHHYVHRDLAARNCLVSDDFIVKISDFGLSRDIYSSDYYRVQSKSLLPVRWMPPESILYGKFTTESDIWSYGVVLWEIYSYGLQPYYGYSNQEVIAMVRGGELLAAPAGCPAPLHALMRDCWRHVPQRRPIFEEIVNRIGEWIQAGGCSEVAESAERAPLLPHYSASSSSLASNSLRRPVGPGSTTSGAGGSRRADDARSTCSDAPPLAPKPYKHSAASLSDAEALRETVVRIPNAQFGNDI